MKLTGGMAYIPHGIRVPTHEVYSGWGWGWMKMADGVGRENGGRRKKEERRKNGGRKDRSPNVKKGSSFVGMLCVL
jgi:hypothetical protein